MVPAFTPAPAADAAMAVESLVQPRFTVLPPPGPGRLHPEAGDAVPLPWPSLVLPGARGPSGAMAFTASRRGELTLALPAGAVHAGGVVLLLHPGDARRRSLAMACDGRELPSAVLAGPGWNRITVPIPAAAGGIRRLVLADPQGPSAPFVLGAALAVADADPEPGMLDTVEGHVPGDLAGRAWIEAHQRRIEGADQVRRRAGVATFAAQPALLARVRVVGGGFPAPAVTALRDRLEAFQGEPCRRGQVDADGTPEDGSWCDWYRERQLQAPTEARRLVPADRYGVLLVAAPGSADRLAARATTALAREVRDLERLALVGDARGNRHGGVLLVVALAGGDAGEPSPELAAARQELRRACLEAGIRCIDPGIAAGQTRAARSAAQVRLLADGLACHLAQIRRLAPRSP